MLQKIKQIPHNLVFFLLAMLYLWFVVEPRLIYQCFGTILPDAPIFLTGWSFLTDSLRLPGGFVMYLSGFFSQGYYYSWLGALIIVLSALGLCELSRRHHVIAGCPRASVLSSLSAVMLVLIYSQYKHPLSVCLAVSLGMGCSLIFERLSSHRLLIRIMVYGLMAGVLFWLVGAGGLLIFTLMAIIYGIFVHRDSILSALAAPTSLGIVWCLAQYIFLVPPRQAFSVFSSLALAASWGLNRFSTVLMIVLFGYVPLCVMLLLLGRKVFGKIGRRREKHSRKSTKTKRRVGAEQTWRFAILLRKTTVTAIPIVLTGAGLYFSYDRMNKPFIQAYDYSMRRQWDAVLKLSRSLPKGRSNVYFNHYVNRALYHTGRLPYDMFSFPQSPHGLLLTHEEKASSLAQLKLCDVYMELGRINTAERLASEILTAKNHSGIVIEKLAWINIIKGQYETARIFLNVLKRDLVYRRTAQTLLKALEDRFTPDQTNYVDTVRSRMHHEGYLGAGDNSVEQILTELLACNPANRMAFEYLMACYLLTGQVDKIVARIDQLKEFDYDSIPALYEEAVLIYFGSQGKKIDLTRINIRRETIDRYLKFVQLTNNMRPENRQTVLKRLIAEFGSSYFFYSVFGRVGIP